MLVKTKVIFIGELGKTIKKESTYYLLGVIPIYKHIFDFD